MTYDPPEIRLGLAISGVGAVLLVLLAALARRPASPAIRSGSGRGSVHVG
jgi:hypothetical protein